MIQSLPSPTPSAPESGRVPKNSYYAPMTCQERANELRRTQSAPQLTQNVRVAPAPLPAATPAPEADKTRAAEPMADVLVSRAPSPRSTDSSVQSNDSFVTAPTGDEPAPSQRSWLGRAAHLVSAPVVAAWRLLQFLWLSVVGRLLGGTGAAAQQGSALGSHASGTSTPSSGAGPSSPSTVSDLSTPSSSSGPATPRTVSGASTPACALVPPSDGQAGAAAGRQAAKLEATEAGGGLPRATKTHWKGKRGLSIDAHGAFRRRLHDLLQVDTHAAARSAAADDRLPRQFAVDAFRDPATLMVPNANGTLERRQVASLLAGANHSADDNALRQVGDWLTDLCRGDAMLARQVAFALSQNTLNSVFAAMVEEPIVFFRPSRLARPLPCMPLFRDAHARELTAVPLGSAEAPGVAVTVVRHIADPIRLQVRELSPEDGRNIEVGGKLVQHVRFELWKTDVGIVQRNLHATLSGQLAGEALSVQLS